MEWVKVHAPFPCLPFVRRLPALLAADAAAAARRLGRRVAAAVVPPPEVGPDGLLEDAVVEEPPQGEPLPAEGVGPRHDAAAAAQLARRLK